MVPEVTNPGIFRSYFSLYYQNKLKFDLKSSGFVPFGANQTYYGPKYDIPEMNTLQLNNPLPPPVLAGVYDTRHMSVEPTIRQKIYRVRDSRSMSVMSHSTTREDEEPNFTAKLKNKRAPEGTSVRLNCSVTGVPEPEIHWFKDGREIFDGSYYTIRVS